MNRISTLGSMRPPPAPGLGDRDPTGGPLQISSHHDGEPVGTVAVALSGELDMASVDQLDAAIRDAEQTDIGWIVVDLSEVTFIDSTGLGVLLNAKMRSDGRFSCIPSKHDAVARLFELTATTPILTPN